MKQALPHKDVKKLADGSLFVIFSAVIMIFVLAISSTSDAQMIRDDSRTPIKILKSRYGLTEHQLKQLRPLIQRSAAGLYKILNKYQDRSIMCCAPFWEEADIWFDLYNVRRQNSPNLTRSQREALQAANSMMEKEILMSLIDGQLLELAEELEFDLYQAEDFYQILVQNMKKNQSLIERPQSDLDLFRRKLEAIANETEIKIAKILLPDQFKKFQKSKQNAQNSIKLLCNFPQAKDADPVFFSHTSL